MYCTMGVLLIHRQRSPFPAGEGKHAADTKCHPRAERSGVKDLAAGERGRSKPLPYGKMKHSELSPATAKGALTRSRSEGNAPTNSIFAKGKTRFMEGTLLGGIPEICSV